MAGRKGFTLIEIMIVVLIIGLLAMIAVPSFVKSRENSRKNACINNLRQIDTAKEQWAMEARLSDGSACADEQSEVVALIKGGAPNCPGGGSYTYGPIGTQPGCSIDGHSLDGDFDNTD